MQRRHLLCLAVAAPVLVGGPAFGQSSAATAGPVVLSLEGQVTGGPRDFTLAALEAIGMETVITTTPWTRGPQEFSGVPLGRLLTTTGNQDTQLLQAEALNRYTVALPAGDAWDNGALLATRLGGEVMRVRDRGPIWLVFPWSSRPELDRSEMHERAIWQLRRIRLQ
jgi:hypothetical protein